MRPAVVGTARKLPVNTVISGYQIPKFTDLVTGSLITSMDEKYFKRSQEFIPERFLKAQSGPELKAQHPFAYLPFGFGARTCIGRRMAELELQILIAK